MRSAVVIGLALMASTAIAPSVAFAQDVSPDWANKNGAVGVGGNTTLGGTNGLYIRTYLTPLVGVALALGFDTGSVTDTVGDEDFTQSQRLIDVGLYGTYKLSYWQRGHLSAIFGLDIASLSQSYDAGGTKTSDSSTDIVIGLGLQGEYFPTQYLSLHAEVGLTIDPISGDEAVVMELGAPADADVSGMDVNLGGDLWGGAGFTVWFE